MRPSRLLAAAVLISVVGVGCTTDTNPTTTTSTTLESTTTADPPTTTTHATSTTLATTTTTASDNPWSIDYPLEAETVDDLPRILTDKIGAEEPDLNLTIEGPEDLERWLDEWLNWFSWVNANPEAGIVALEHAVIPVSTFYEEEISALESRREEGTALLGYAFVPNRVTGTFDEFFERQELLRLVVTASDTIPRYVIDGSGAVVDVIEPLGGEASFVLALRYRESQEEWVLESLEVGG